MRILIIADNIGAPSHTFIRQHVEIMSQHASCHVISSSLGPYDALEGVDYHLLEYEQNDLRITDRLVGKFFKKIPKNSAYGREIEQTIQEVSPDVIHVHFGDCAARVLISVSERTRMGYSWVIHFHGFDATRLLQNSLRYKNTLRNLSKNHNVNILCCSEYLRSELKKHLFDLSRSEVIYYALDTSFFKGVRIKKKSQIIQVSSFQEKKGHKYTIQVFSELKKIDRFKKWHLVLIGDGNELDNCKRLARDLGVERDVSFLGWLPPEEIKQYLSPASLFVHHSITDAQGNMEGMPNAILEAMSVNLPILSTRHSGIPEIRKEIFPDFVLVGEKGEGEYLEQWIKVLDRMENTDHMEIGNRSHVESKFSRQIIGEELFDYYNKLLMSNSSYDH